MSTIICVASISPVTVYCSVTHTAGDQLKKHMSGPVLTYTPQQGPAAGQRENKAKGKSQQAQERPQAIRVGSHRRGNRN